MKKSEWYKMLSDELKELSRAERDVEKTSERRRLLPPGSSRARVTTANARWSQAAEWRDYVRDRLNKMGLKIPSAPHGDNPQVHIEPRIDVSRVLEVIDG